MDTQGGCGLRGEGIYGRTDGLSTSGRPFCCTERKGMMSKDYALEAALRHFTIAQNALNNALLMERQGLMGLAETDLAEAVTHETCGRLCEEMAERIL